MKLLHEEFPKVQSLEDLRALVGRYGLDLIGSSESDGDFPQVDQYVRADGGMTSKILHFWHGEKSREPRRNSNKLTLEIRWDGEANARHLGSIHFWEP